MRIRCPHCQKFLAVPESAAGKRVRCPKCQGEMKIPAPRRAPTVDYEDHGALLETRFEEFPEVDAPIDAKKCPYCKQVVPRRAIRCPLCEADLEVRRPPKKRKKKRPKKEEVVYSSSGRGELSVGDLVFCIVCSGIALLISFFYMLSGDSRGTKMFLVALVADVAKAVLFIAARQGMK